MDLIASKTRSPRDLISSTGPLRSESEDLQRLKAGRDAAKSILSRFPDYGKSPPEYLAGMSELLSTFPADMLRTMTDPRIGISAKHKFSPTQADVIEFADHLRQKRESVRDLRQGRVPEPIGLGVKAMPFPKLWAAFADEPHLLHRNFEMLADAARSLAMHGKDEARNILRRGASIA